MYDYQLSVSANGHHENAPHQYSRGRRRIVRPSHQAALDLPSAHLSRAILLAVGALAADARCRYHCFLFALSNWNILFARVLSGSGLVGWLVGWLVGGLLHRKEQQDPYLNGL